MSQETQPGDCLSCPLTILPGNASVRQAATIVLSARESKANAQAACEALQETLWSPGEGADLDFLRYLDHDQPSDEVGQYWIGSARNSTTCITITTVGEISEVPCATTLPALCSQSAALSSKSSNNTGPQWQTTVRTGEANIVGYRDKLSFRFLGLKYASFPSRFTYSTYQAPRGNVSALVYGPGCIQGGCSTPTCSEQCLYLNVWTPHLPSNSQSPKKAVMFWIHGGGFATGYGSDTTFDGGNMASRGDVVVVTINYRLSTLGFLALDNTTSRGNYWLSDQVAALEWVQNHIEDFGGDKERVTVFGQSAGGASVRALLASPHSKGTFSRAIMQSCTWNPDSRYLTLATALNNTLELSASKNCTQQDEAGRTACLRALDPATLVTGIDARAVVVDGEYILTPELLLDGSGPSLDVALMTGIMRDDGAAFTSFSTSSNASQTLADQGYDANAILSSGLFPYPNSTNATLDMFNLTARVTTDAQLRCAAEYSAYAAVLNKVFPAVYAYEMDRALQLIEYSPNPPMCEAPPSPSHPLGDTSLPYYKCHSGELYYVFGTAMRQGRPPRDQHDVPFSQYLLDTWTAFGRTRDPNPDLGFLRARAYANTSRVVQMVGAWTPVGTQEPKARVLDVRPRDERFREQEQCDVLGLPLGYYGG